MPTRRRYFGRVLIDKISEDNSDLIKSTSNNVSVYVPINVRHTLFNDASLREACNLHEYKTIQNKSTILSVNLNKLPYLVRFSITLQLKRDSKIFKKMPLYAVKRTLFQSTEDILNQIAKVKVWKLNNEDYELVQIMGPKERVKRILKNIKETKEKRENPTEDSKKKNL